MIMVQAVAADKIGSRLIRWGLGEGASHLAIRFPNHVYHATLAGGFHVTSKLQFSEDYAIVDEVVFSCREDEERRVEGVLSDLVANSSYDVSGFFYFTWRAFLRKAFKIPFPAVNAGDDPDRTLCVEVLFGFLEAWATITGRTILQTDASFSMSSPLDCLAELRKAQPWLLRSPSLWPSSPSS